MLVALCRAPEIQRRAQAEIDKVVGRDRLPDWSDREKLPYVEAIFYELMRWRLAAPVGKFIRQVCCSVHNSYLIGTTRSSLEEDVYNGYYIPKGNASIRNLRMYAKWIKPHQALWSSSTFGKLLSSCNLFER